jgi:hypothetical protein
MTIGIVETYDAIAAKQPGQLLSSRSRPLKM